MSHVPHLEPDPRRAGPGDMECFVMNDFKPRDDQRGADDQPSGKASVEKAKKVIDQGPNFGTPGDPPDADPDAIKDIGDGLAKGERKK